MHDRQTWQAKASISLDLENVASALVLLAHCQQVYAPSHSLRILNKSQQMVASDVAGCLTSPLLINDTAAAMAPTTEQ